MDFGHLNVTSAKLLKITSGMLFKACDSKVFVQYKPIPNNNGGGAILIWSLETCKPVPKLKVYGREQTENI